MNQDTNSNTHDRQQRQWLASILLRHGERVLPRFARLYDELTRRPRAWRRQLKRRLAVTVTGAAMLLALAGLGGLDTGARAAPANEITVVNNEVNVNKNNKCSLIEAIENANDTNDGRPHTDCAAGNPNGADTIILPNNGKFTVNKNVEPDYSQFGYTALPLITSTITVEGNGATINRTGQDQMRFFTVVGDPDGDPNNPAGLTLNNLTLTNGKQEYYKGGAVYIHYGDLAINGTTISGTSSYAGAVSGNYATITITDSTLTKNTAYTGGGVYASESNVTINYSTISNNTANYYGGGVSASFGSLTITNSIITGNRSTGGAGGGVYASDVITLISESSISNNRSAYHGGGLVISTSPATISGSQISNNTTDEYGDGGGIYSLYATLTVLGSRIDGNRSNYGGGILMYGGTTTVKSTTVSGNRAVQGGGIYVWQGSELVVANSTLSGNTATQFGGGLGGGGNATVTNATLSGNTASKTGGGIHVTLGTVTLRQSLLAGNTAPTGRELHRQAGTVNVNAHNLFGFGNNAGLSGVTAGATDVVPTVGLANVVAPLANNSGGTSTHALPANSPAIDVAPSAACAADPVGGFDQRGQPRNANGRGSTSANECDVGAFELQPAGNVDTPTPTATVQPTATSTPTITRTPPVLFTATATGTVVVLPTASATIPGGPTATATSPGGPTATATAPGGPTATATVPGGPTATATVPGGPTATATIPAPDGERVYLPVVLDQQ